MLLSQTGVRRGVDTFDCVHPTRLGRHGGALVKAQHWVDQGGEGRKPKPHIQLRHNQFASDLRPITPGCK
jgi:queuine tRNA-ribosyltransferase